MSEIENLFFGALIGNIVSFAGGFLLHFAIEYFKTRADLRKAASSILTELENTETELNKIGEVDLQGNMVFISLPSIDSVIFSGLFREFDVKTQYSLDKVNYDVKMINDLIREAFSYYRAHASEIELKRFNDYQKKKVFDSLKYMPQLKENLRKYVPSKDRH